MTNKKIVISLIIAIIISITMIGNVNAASNSFTFTVEKSQVTAKLGDTITVDLGIADIDQETNGIHAIQGDLSYNEDLFESVEIVSAGNNWTVSLNKEENNSLKGRFIINNMNSVKDPSVVAVLKAKIKNDATVTTGEITLKDVFSSYGTTETAKTTKTITVNIEKEQNEEKDPVIPDNNNTSGPQNETVKNETVKNETIKDTDTQKTNKTQTTSNATNLPKAGLSYWIIIAIVVSVIGAIAGYIKYKKTY